MFGYLRSKKKELKIAAIFLLVCIALSAAIWWAWNDWLTSPPYVDADHYPIRGIDVSSHNGMMNLDAAAEDNVDFIFIKASEGASFRDPNFRINYDKAVKAGLMTGAYHFFRFDVDGVSQAINFLWAIGNRKLDLGIAIDVEQAGNPANVPTEVVIDRLSAMIEFLNMKNYEVILYSNTQGFYDYISQNFRDMPLWICSFSSIPAEADWTFWQYYHRGRVKGINGDVDLNAFYGSRKEWHDFLKSRQRIN